MIVEEILIVFGLSGFSNSVMRRDYICSVNFLHNKAGLVVRLFVCFYF